ncbi:guanine deaminase-like [Mytilus edulis]|uniref:guanine deaminase-like n=1 Tax=Mytilus edulis TaxID=6550 RepID=UPI0039EE26A8
MDRPLFVIRGMFAHSTNENPLIVFADHIIGVSNGKIVFFDQADQIDKHLEPFGGRSKVNITELKRGQFVIPGFIDTHIHAPQYPNSGKGLDLGLLEWLEKYTFPTEAKFKDLKFAEHVYEKAVRRVLRNGTTTACYYGTIHTDACVKLCDIIDKYGQRAFVGKVNMNQNSPEYYIETAEESQSETERFVDSVLERKNQRIQPIITPRFAVSCDHKLMNSLAKLAHDKGLHVQTHISETKAEVDWIGNLFPDHDHYVDVYDQAGLLSKKTVLAHGIYLTTEERKIVKDRECGISHCPNSNTSIRSGTCDVRQLLHEGIKVGLGTDCSGGYSTSMHDAMRCCLHVSNFHAIHTEKVHISHREAFMMATLGGAQVLDLADTVGNFEVGKAFDALAVDVTKEGSQIDIFENDTKDDIFQKFIYLGNEHNFTRIYIDGVDVLPKL